MNLGHITLKTEEDVYKLARKCAKASATDEDVNIGSINVKGKISVDEEELYGILKDSGFIGFQLAILLGKIAKYSQIVNRPWYKRLFINWA